MNQALRKDAQQILASSLQAVLPDEAVQRALRDFEPHGGRVLLVAAGKGSVADGGGCGADAGQGGRRRGGDQIPPRKGGHSRGGLLRRRTPGAGRRQLCRHPESTGAGAGT